MGTKGSCWLYGTMLCAAFWVLVVGAQLLLAGYRAGAELPLAVTAVLVVGIGGVLMGALEWWHGRHEQVWLNRLRDTSKEDMRTFNCWTYGLMQGVKLLVLIVVVTLASGMEERLPVWRWVASSVFMLGGGALLMGGVERWRWLHLVKEENYGN